jgi:hypothetical protein
MEAISQHDFRNRTRLCTTHRKSIANPSRILEDSSRSKDLSAYVHQVLESTIVHMLSSLGQLVPLTHSWVSAMNENTDI